MLQVHCSKNSVLPSTAVRLERPRSPVATACRQSVSRERVSVCLTSSDSSEAAQCGCAGAFPSVNVLGKCDRDAECC